MAHRQEEERMLNDCLGRAGHWDSDKWKLRVLLLSIQHQVLYCVLGMARWTRQDLDLKGYMAGEVRYKSMKCYNVISALRVLVRALKMGSWLTHTPVSFKTYLKAPSPGQTSGVADKAHGQEGPGLTPQCLGLSPRSASKSSLLWIYTFCSVYLRWQQRFKYLGPCHPSGGSGLNSQLLAPAQPLWLLQAFTGMNQWMQVSSACLLKSSLSHREAI